MNPKVSIVCITYNHEKFIAEALDSILMQKTNFPFEIIIGEDCSSDTTADIVRKYANTYPDIIKPIFQENNTGPYNNTIAAFQQVHGKYIVINEGDDYFTDPLKLQKQVEFLDANPKYSICFHPVKVIWEDKSHQDYVFPEPKYRNNKNILTMDELLKNNFIQTNSCMFRWRFSKDQNLSDYYPREILPGDWYLYLLHAQVGKIGFIPETMSVYRKHNDGIWYLANENVEKLCLRYGTNIINFYYNVYKNITNSSEKYFEIFMENFQKIINVYYKNKKFSELNLINSKYPDFFDLTIERSSSEETKIYKKYLKYRKIFKILLLTNIIFLILIIYMIF